MTTSSLHLTAQSVASLRKEGKLEEALLLAEELLAESPDNIWNRRVLGWVLADLIKSNVFHMLSLKQILHRLISLELQSDEALFFNQIRWRLGSVIYRLDSNQVTSIEKPFAELLGKMPIHKSNAHSFLLKSILNQQKFWLDLPALIDAWGYENFIAHDWLPETLPGGKECHSLVERTYSAVAKWFLSKESKREMVFAARIEVLLNGDQVWKYLEYYYALFLKRQCRYEEAQARMLSYARKNQNSFWVWELLAELTVGDLSRACLVRAVSCKVPAEFLVKTRERLAAVWIESGDWERASYEINALLKARHSKGWSVPDVVKGWRMDPRYSSREVDTSILYTSLIDLADAFLLDADEGVNGVIVGVNKDRQTAQFYVSEEISGGFKVKDSGSLFELGQSITLWLDKKSGSSGTYWRVQRVEVSYQRPLESQRKFFSGVIRPAGTVGFVEDVLVLPHLISKSTPGQPVEGIAVRAYNSKRQNWGWKAINIANVAEK